VARGNSVVESRRAIRLIVTPCPKFQDIEIAVWELGIGDTRENSRHLFPRVGVRRRCCERARAVRLRCARTRVRYEDAATCEDPKKFAPITHSRMFLFDLLKPPSSVWINGI
jgi:hypothetical protein